MTMLQNIHVRWLYSLPLPDEVGLIDCLINFMKGIQDTDTPSLRSSFMLLEPVPTT